MDRGLSQVKASGDNLRALSDIVKDSIAAAVQIAEAIRAEIQPLLNPDAQPPGGSLRERLRLQRSRGRDG